MSTNGSGVRSCKGKIFVFNRKKSEMLDVRKEIIRQMAEKKYNRMPKGPLRVDYRFYMGGAKDKDGEREGDWWPKTPDLENCVKLYNDVIKDLLIEDDRFICASSQEKYYSKEQYLTIEISCLNTSPS